MHRLNIYKPLKTPMGEVETQTIINVIVANMINDKLYYIQENSNSKVFNCIDMCDVSKVKIESEV